MAEKQSILGRVAQLARANLNAVLDRAEDPQKMLDQLVRDYTNSIVEAEQAVAVTIGNLRLTEQDYNEDVAAVREWGNKALAASQAADAARNAGDAAKADKFDALVKVALRKQLAAETEVRQAEPMIASQRDTVDKLKSGLASMRDKLGDLRTRRDSLVARHKSAEAQQTVQGAISSINVLDPTSELSRFEEVVRREEALAVGQAEIAATSIDVQFEELEASGDAIEVEERFAALKSGRTPAPQIAPTQVTPEDAPVDLYEE